MFAIIYSKNTGRIRWILKPENDSENYLLDNINLNTGEVSLILEDSEYKILPELQELLNKKTGLIQTNDRFVIVDKKGDVKGSIIADLSCGDSIDDHELIPHQTADIGWKYDKLNGLKDERPTPIPLNNN
jgi:hypothetical protein